MNLLSLIKNNHIYGMIFRGVILISTYLFFYHYLRTFNTINTAYVDILNIYAEFLVKTTRFFLDLLGYEVVTFGKTVRIIGNLPARGVFLNRGCMGRDFLLFFAGFIIAFPGKIKNKLWYIPMGLVILIIVNILRISGLAIINDCCPDSQTGINNHDVFKYAAWGAIVILWYIWINKFSPVAKKKQ